MVYCQPFKFFIFNSLLPRLNQGKSKRNNCQCNDVKDNNEPKPFWGQTETCCERFYIWPSPGNGCTSYRVMRWFSRPGMGDNFHGWTILGQTSTWWKMSRAWLLYFQNSVVFYFVPLESPEDKRQKSRARHFTPKGNLASVGQTWNFVHDKLTTRRYREDFAQQIKRVEQLYRNVFSYLVLFDCFGTFFVGGRSYLVLKWPFFLSRFSIEYFLSFPFSYCSGGSRGDGWVVVRTPLTSGRLAFFTST